jgi:hypothetical protein
MYAHHRQCTPLEVSLISFERNARSPCATTHESLTIISTRFTTPLYSGNTFDRLQVRHGKWQNDNAGIGAGVDSYYEYLLKAYMLIGSDTYLDMFQQAYTVT